MGSEMCIRDSDVSMALQLADDVWLMERHDNKRTLTIGTPRSLADEGILQRFIEGEGISFDSNTLTIHVVP